MKFLFTFFTFGIFLWISANTENGSTGSTAAAMAGTSITNIDVFASSNNPAATAFLTQHALGFYFQNKYLLPELNGTHACFVFQNNKIGSFSSSLSHSGYKVFNETISSLAYARKFGSSVSTGLKLSYHQLKIQENGSKALFALQLSLLYKIRDQLVLGLVVNNPIKQKLNAPAKESLPTTIAIGIGYHPSEKLRLAMQLQKDLKYPIQASLGVEYQIHKILSTRLGAGINPLLLSGGIAFQLQAFDIAISSSWDQYLGFSPQLSLQYAFGK